MLVLARGSRGKVAARAAVAAPEQEQRWHGLNLAASGCWHQLQPKSGLSAAALPAGGSGPTLSIIQKIVLVFLSPKFLLPPLKPSPRELLAAFCSDQ